jgi:CubicO group peptidase (beta-lactamase class C family)
MTSNMSNKTNKSSKEEKAMLKVVSILLFCTLLPAITAHASPTNIILKPLDMDALVKAIKNGKYPKIHSVIIADKKEILFEQYFNGHSASQRHDTRSAFKSITSLLTGIAIDKKFISNVNSKVLPYFPEYTNFKNQDIRKSEITLAHLLTMTSGLKCEEFFDIGPYCEDEMSESKDWIKYSLDLAMSHKPGEYWAYTSSEPMVLGGVISNASNKTIMNFAKQYLFEPLAITDYQWTIDPAGRGMTAGSFFMKSSDMAKIGQLVLNKGLWNNQRIISENWINESTKVRRIIDNFSFVKSSQYKDAIPHTSQYGYYWYRELLTSRDINTEVLFASGNGGQYIMIFEDYDMVVVFNGGNFGNWRGKMPFEIVLKYILPSINK